MAKAESTRGARNTNWLLLEATPVPIGFSAKIGKGTKHEVRDHAYFSAKNRRFHRSRGSPLEVFGPLRSDFGRSPEDFKGRSTRWMRSRQAGFWVWLKTKQAGANRRFWYPCFQLPIGQAILDFSVFFEFATAKWILSIHSRCPVLVVLPCFRFFEFAAAKNWGPSIFSSPVCFRQCHAPGAAGTRRRWVARDFRFRGRS